MNNQYKKTEIVLVSTPFLEYILPSAQLAALQAYLESKDICVKAMYSYVKFHEQVGSVYADLLNNNEYAEWIYIQYLFPDYYKKEKKKIEKLIKEKLHLNGYELNDLSEKISRFNEWLIESILIEKCMLVGFTITYNQLMPSLYISHELKKRCKNINIIFGGSRVNGDLGKSLLNNYDWVDTLLSGEGEESLYKYIIHYYNEENEGAFVSKRYEETKCYADINSLPIPEYSDYLEIIQECRLSKENVFYFYEIARGCWWNRCTFCSSSRLYNKYREKRPDIVAKNLIDMNKKYNINKIWLLGDCYSFSSYIKLANILETYGVTFDFIVYSRCSLEISYYSALKKMGVNTIIVGIEAISDSLLKKMDKGCLAIANIQCLKICSKFKINCVYNLFYSYPNFDEIDYLETINNIVSVSGYQPPESLCDMELQYGSKIFMSPETYDISNVYYTEFDKICFQNKIKSFKYDYEKSRDTTKYSQDIISKVQQWNETYERYGINKVLYYIEIEDALIIYDNRPFTSLFQYQLDSEEREIFLYCNTIKKKYDIYEKFEYLGTEKIEEILKKLTSVQIMFSSNNMYLSLPIQNK